MSLWEFEKLYTLREQRYMWQRCTHIEALTSAVVSTLVLKCSGFPLPNRTAPPPSPIFSLMPFLLETDYEPKHLRLGSSLVHNANDSCATLLFSFFSLPTFRLQGK